jgi:hypothetical protein
VIEEVAATTLEGNISRIDELTGLHEEKEAPLDTTIVFSLADLTIVSRLLLLEEVTEIPERAQNLNSCRIEHGDDFVWFVNDTWDLISRDTSVQTREDLGVSFLYDDTFGIRKQDHM